ncbi:unnamed protein product [Mytilus edulis]|uniref:Mutator-like transposase domain-containing protein n=1 Tax=Mytilus edulis TaxID=6550 RepID=A0A8S3QBY9_MYTED|nr:unnamed protein product [Mytilus edulis]
MKGKRKRNQYKVGNQAHLLRSVSLTTDQGCSVINGVAPSTAPSTQVLKNLSMQVLPAPPKLKFSNSTTDLTPKNTTESVWLPRLTEKEFKLYSKESYDKKSYVAPQTEKCATTVKLLRPHKLSDDYLDEYLEEKSTENRTVDRDLNILMINSLIICHLNKKKYKLFREIDTGRAGRKSATINYGFQTGVINCNIGNDSARLLLTSSCIPPMSKGTMQRITNNVCDKVVKLAENETEQVVESFRKRNQTLGLNKNSPVKLQMDGTYQSVHIKSKKIAKLDLLVDYCTTDGDAKSVQGLQEAMQEIFDPLWSVNRLADTIHRGQSQFREVLRAKFSVGMFPGATKAQRNDIKIAFANDLKLRSHGIMKCLFAKYNGDRQQISKCLPRIVKSVVNCYSGNCSDTCRWSITLCNGGIKTSWWYKSINLSSHGLQNGSLKPNKTDKLLIESLLEMKLSQTALNQMQFFSNTNKCESVNRTISTYLPKNKNFSRNALGRASAAVLKVNNKRDVALAKTLKAVGCGLGRKSRAVVALKKIRKREIYDCAYQKSLRVKLNRLKARKKQAIDFLLNRVRNRLISGYKKHQLEPKLCQNSSPKEFVPQPGCSSWPD